MPLRRKKAVFAFTTLVAVLAGVEGVLRLTLPIVRTASLPNQMVDQHVGGGGFVPDPDLFWTWAELPEPGAQIDEHGFRRLEELTVSKPKGLRRAITFGDSQTYGAGVDATETWSQVAEDHLQGWQVLNRGVSGYRSLQVYRLLQADMLRFEPDLVIVDCMPSDSPRDDGPTARRGWGLRTLLWNSRLYYALRLAVDKARPDRSRWLDEQGELSSGQAGNHDLIWGWAQEHDIDVLFVWYPVSTDDFTLSCHTREGELPDGAPSFNACAVLREAGNPINVRRLFLDRNHLTVKGNRVVGEALAARIDELWPR